MVRNLQIFHHLQHIREPLMIMRVASDVYYFHLN
jgi:hypothetical protein